MKPGTWVRLRLRVPRLAALLTTGVFLALVIAQAPHLVHHAFERGQHPTDCLFLSAAEHSPGLVGDMATTIAAEPIAVRGWVPDPPRAASPALTPSAARAPPLLPS